MDKLSNTKNSLKECVFVNSALKKYTYTDYFFGDFAHWEWLNFTHIFIWTQAALFPPQLSELVLKFCSSTSYWLNQLTMAGTDYLNMSKHREMKSKNLPGDQEVCS